jgi:hypothetical protein
MAPPLTSDRPAQGDVAQPEGDRPAKKWRSGAGIQNDASAAVDGDVAEVDDLAVVSVIVFVAWPQLKVITPPPLLAVTRALSNAVSVQLAGLPLPTTAFAARAGRTLTRQPNPNRSSETVSTLQNWFIFSSCP